MSVALSTRPCVCCGGAWRYSTYFARRSHRLGTPVPLGALDGGFRVFRRVT